MAHPVYSTDPTGWQQYIQSLSTVPGKDPLASFQNWRDPYGVLDIYSSASSPQSRPATSDPNGPQTGTGAFGLVPGPIALPSPSDDLQKLLPDLTSSNSAAMGAILPMLRGELSPDVRAQIENEGATFGTTSGMPGSDFSKNKTLRDLGLTSLQVQQQGLGDLNNLVGSTSATQTVNPSLQAAISGTNQTNAAAPNPEAQGSYASQLFNKYLQAMAGNQNKSRNAATGQTAGSILGAIGGGIFGGPAGAAGGSSILGALGGAIGGLF